MLLAVQLLFRSVKNDGSAITAQELSLIGSPIPYSVDGLGEEERSANFGTTVSLDSFKGRGASDRFFDATNIEIDKFCVFLSGLNQDSFQSFIGLGVKCDIFVEFKIDENMMDFVLPLRFVAETARLCLPISILVNPGE